MRSVAWQQFSMRRVRRVDAEEKRRAGRKVETGPEAVWEDCMVRARRPVGRAEGGTAGEERRELIGT